jgi:hypothetical protein
MGGSLYDTVARGVRADKMAYHSAKTDDTFQQNKRREVHESMKPQGVKLREACDSDVHPFTIPIILALDVTGSMREIPEMLIKNGLPTLMSKLIQNGAKDATLMFLAIGDHVYDTGPFQVGQFESGDEELDMWLTRTWLEGGGGGNQGESYLLSWYFAAKHTKLDSFDKRGEKGFLITIGDEPCLTNLPASVIKGLFDVQCQKNYSDVELLELAREKYNIFHINVEHGAYTQREASTYWNNLLNQNCITTKDYNEIPIIISNIVIDNTKDYAYVKGTDESKPFTVSPSVADKPEIIL